MTAQLYTNHTQAQAGVTITLSVLILTDLIGNTLVILIILRNKSMKSPMNYLLINLAVADIIVGVFLSPQYIFNHFFVHPDGFTGTMFCKFLTSGIFAWVGAVASSFTLVVIACERYFAIVYPYSTKLKLNMKRLKWIVFFCWPYACLFNFPSFYALDFNQEVQLCTEQWSKQKYKWFSTAFGISWLVFVGVLPIAIMFVLYSRVVYTLWFKQQQAQGTQLAMLKTRKRVTKMVVIVSVIYAVCWFPILLTYVLSQHDSELVLATMSYVVSVVMAVCNSAVNPFVYTLQSEKFRRHMMELLCCRKKPRICNIAAVDQGKSRVENRNTFELETRLANKHTTDIVCRKDGERKMNTSNSDQTDKQTAI